MSRTSVIPLLLVAVVSAFAIAFSVQIAGLTLAGGLLFIALQLHLQRASRTPWRSQRSDLITLLALALSSAVLALLLP